MKKQIILLPATLLLALGAVQGQDVKERLKAHVYTLASDEFAGRKPNTHGDTLAANYIREQLKAMPGFKLLAKDGLQEFSYQAYRNLAAEGNTLKAGKRALTLGRDFLKKDVIVILFGAEERGLKGSRYYAANPVEPLDNVKAMVNIDMMGRMPAEKTLGIRGLGSAYEAPALFASLPNNDNLELVWEFREKGPTDYSSFYDKGIPAFSFGTPHHVDYHKPTDTKERVNYDGMVMVYDYATNLINRLAFEPLRLTYRPQQK